MRNKAIKARMHLKLSERMPRSAKPLAPSTEAWFYWNKSSIDICVRRSNGIESDVTLSCRITRRQLEAFVKHK